MSPDPTMLSSWQIVQLARHPERPRTLDYVARLMPDFMELHGDRVTGDDRTLVGGPATFDGTPIMLLAHAPGRSADGAEGRASGLTRPAGFRKATRLVQLADRLGLPIVSLIDTPGGYPGATAEEQGQAWAISSTIDALAQAMVPVVACVVGEGGSGGAVALAVADSLLMQEFAIFPVISPEACFAILYRDGSHAEALADSLRLTARDLHALHLIDEVVPEPPGGAHLDAALAIELAGGSLSRALVDLQVPGVKERLGARERRLRGYGLAALAGANAPH